MGEGGGADRGGLEFPCGFPLKVVGRNTAAFEDVVRGVLRRHLGETDVVYERRESSGGRYLSVTATFKAESREQLDAIYRELSAHELIMVTL